MKEWEYNLIKRNIFELMDIDLTGYKCEQMKRRLAAYLVRSGHASWTNFFKSIRNDSTAQNKLKNYLTINVSSFFRDDEKYIYLRNKTLPELLTNGSSLKIWSAGCSRGQEPYSIAILLAELTSLRQQHYILATDLDRAALAHAKAGGPYNESDMTRVSESQLKKHFILREDGYYVNLNLQRKIKFQQHNLLTDKFNSGFDLIICRNVVIYFTAEVKNTLYNHFCQALRIGGILFIGGTEIVSRYQDIGFETAGISFYRRTM
ncbi:MAG: hypothetical protein B6242_04645 [Anaerolineaceae bacterium 4572_78]|nr:MAG: hypothetical protein B6242_04645 [Anaerolineaceae bacterium 4572_78]